MTPEETAARLGAAPDMGPDRGGALHRFVAESGAADVLVLGARHGSAACYAGAALAARGRGTVTALDHEDALKLEPNVEELVARAGLGAHVAPILTRYTPAWELMKTIEARTARGRCRPRFDLCVLSGPHTWESDGLGFFLAEKLLRPGGWIALLNHRFTPRPRPGQFTRPPPETYLVAPVERVAELLVRQHPGIAEVVVDERRDMVWARKRGRTRGLRRARPRVEPPARARKRPGPPGGLVERLRAELGDRAAARRVVIGCGTGRSGTVSLASLLDGCEGVRCTHEEPPVLPWELDERRLVERIERFLDDDAPITGDCAFYYLPYLEALLAVFPRLRVVCLERDRDEVVASYLGKIAGRNHLMRHDGTLWRLDSIWDPAYPTYDPPADLSRPEGPADRERAVALLLGRYWDDYRRWIREVAARHPGAVHITDIDRLNSREGQREIFDALEIPEGARAYRDEIRLNVGRPPAKAPPAGDDPGRGARVD